MGQTGVKMHIKLAGSRGCKIKLFRNLIIVTSMATIVSVLSTTENSIANVTFSGNVVDDNNNGGGDPDPGDGDDPSANGRCTIQVGRNGSFGTVTPATGINPTTLDSRSPDGRSAQILVSSFLPSDNTSRGFRITLEAPSSFLIAPAGANSDLQFDSFFSGNSINNGIDFPEQDGENSQELPATGVGATLITGHLRASKLVGNLPTGSYQAVSVFRCE